MSNLDTSTHFCTQDPCPVQDKEYADRLKAGCKTIYTPKTYNKHEGKGVLGIIGKLEIDNK